MNYSKILLSAAMIAFTSALVFGGTQAFFSDEETSTGNTFTAGEIDLTVDSVAHYNGLVCFNDEWVPEDAVEWNSADEELEVVANDLNEAIAEFNQDNPTNYPQAGDECDGTWSKRDLGGVDTPANTFFNYDDLKPGDHGENTISLHLETNPGYACAIIDNVQDDDNGITEPEGEAGDVTDGAGEGELSEELRFFAWVDDGDNIWEDGEAELFSNTEGSASDVIDGVVYPLFTPDTIGEMPANSTAYIGLYWCYGDITVDNDNFTLACDGSSVSNLSQTDSLIADIGFYVEQSRNNENFQCPEIDEERELPEADEETNQGFSNVDLDDEGGTTGKEWFAKARNNNDGFEVAVGSDDTTVAGQDTAEATWVAGASNPFILSYDGAGSASMTAGGDTTTFLVGTGTSGYSRIGITAKAPADATTTVENLALDVAAPLVMDSLISVGGTNYLTLSGLDLDQAWELTGDFTFSQVGTFPGSQQENPAVQFSID